MLQNQCELWSGPIAAVAYMPLLKGKLVSMDDAALNGTTVEEQKANLASFYKTVTHAGQHADCWLFYSFASGTFPLYSDRHSMPNTNSHVSFISSTTSNHVAGAESLGRFKVTSRLTHFPVCEASCAAVRQLMPEAETKVQIHSTLLDSTPVN